MKRLALLFLTLNLTSAFAATGDTTRITVIEKYLWTAHGHKDTTVLFPDASKTYEKIILRYTLTCPTGGCGEWDYTTGVIVRHHVGDSVIPYELTRFITPYGKGFPKDWTRTWTMDVTDFSSLLRDSVELRSFYDGYTQGSLYTLDFLFIEGTPPRNTYKVEKIYDGYFYYGNPDNPIEDHLSEKKLYRDQNADLVTLRLTVSGHGSDPNGACEFIDKTHSIWVNGDERYQQHLWRDDCGINPTWPQTGTYWFPRGGWCPGDLVYPFDYDLTTFSQKGDSIAVDYNMEEYESSNPTGGYNVHGLIFYSSGPSFNIDAAVTDIIQPTSDFRHSRTNPICDEMRPIVVIRNNGKTPLTSCMIGYWIDGKLQNEVYWTGNLNFLETAKVSLPKIELGTGTHAFYAKVFNPNETTDEYANNDVAMTTYTTPKSYSNKIAFQLRTDRNPSNSGITNDIRWKLLDGESGAIIKEGSGYAEGELVRDTFTLSTGCYRFIIYDEGLGEGLMPWVLSGSSNGSYSLRDDKNALIVNCVGSNYTAEFGNKNITTFKVQAPADVSSGSKAQASFSVFPNPAHNSITLDLTAFSGEQVTIELYDLLGHLLMTRSANSEAVDLELDNLAEGSYIVRVESATAKASQSIAIKR